MIRSLLIAAAGLSASALRSHEPAVPNELGGNPPSNFAQLECQVAQFAYQYASSKVPNNTTSSKYIYDALNVDYLCTGLSGVDDLSSMFGAGFEREAARLAAERGSATALPSAPVTTFYIATDGNDNNGGTLQAPFATLGRAAAAARAVTGKTADNGVLIYIRSGTYYLGDAPLVLGAADSNVTWSSYPPDVQSTGPPVLSGARRLANLTWTPYTGGVPGILVAPVSNVVDERRTAWMEAHPEGYAGSPPPPLVASLFVDSVRQVRARFPNGNPQQGDGVCFSASQRPGEGCPSYSSCVSGQTGNQPAPNGHQISNISPNRGNSPTWGCQQCAQNYGSFQYTIFPPPPNHPVYNTPLPGMGWPNSSLFSFWGSPFDRPNGVTVSAGACDGGHWSSASYAKPSDMIVHAFHPSLWGGWQFAVSNFTVGGPSLVSSTEPEIRLDAVNAAAAPPPGMSLWLRADDLSASLTNGQAVASWADASGRNDGAAQASGQLQPTFMTNCFGNLPCVNFDSAQWLDNDNFTLPAQSTIFAVIQDTGSTTNYGSGVFFSKGGRNGLGSMITDSVASNDDDPAPVGKQIPVLMMDWDGSLPAPGHRDLSARPAVIAVAFGPSSTLGFVDGCLEIQDSSPHGSGGDGYEIGTRNAEMGRYFKGHIGEILVYPSALDETQRAAVNTYLTGKWNTPVPKKCEAPSANSVTLSFGYGGYQEARGGSVHPGQHFYLENALEELDVPGEWYFDADTQMLYVLPNGTDLSTAEIAIPLADQIITINGSVAGGYASNITFTGFTFTQSRVTFLEQYEVPSGGDWSLHRGGAVLVQDAEGITISSCIFNQTGGNGVLFSNHVTDSAITDSEFHYTGDSAVLFIGSTMLADGSLPTYPNNNLVARNHIHEWGVYGKQTSCFAQALAANSTVVDNVCYNGPRAGINYNDGFGGGNYVARNVVFNSVRETGDHGPLNTWDRQPYWTRNGVNDGFPTNVKPVDCPDCSFVRAWDINERNMMINGYNGVWTYDHDDGSQFVSDQYSFMIWGGCKNYLGNRKNCSNNVILYPGVNGRSSGNRRCQTDDNGEFAEQFHENNVCTAADGQFYSFSNCNVNPNNLNSTCYHTDGNTLYADTGSTFSQSCGQTVNFQDWQSLGQDGGSTTSPTPDVAQLMALGAAVLGL